MRSGADTYDTSRSGRDYSLSLTRKGMLSRVASNPVASALGFLHYTRGLFKYLIGMEEDKHTRKSVPLAHGVFGRIVAGAVAFEAQGKGASLGAVIEWQSNWCIISCFIHVGTLHGHGMFWGGVPARLLEAGAEFPAVVKRLAAIIAEMVTAELPLASHVQALLDKLHKRYEPMPSTSMAPDPDAEPELFEQWVCNCGQRRNIHRHCLTCMKKPAGEYGCRMALPQALQEKTTVTQIVGTSIKRKGEKQRVEVRALPQVLVMPII
jgi:hypothetical protein